MNREITILDSVRSYFLDFYLSDSSIAAQALEGEMVNIPYIRLLMRKQIEFPIYTPANALFCNLLQKAINNDGVMEYLLMNLDGHYDSPWADFVNQAFIIRSLNSAKKPGFPVRYEAKYICERFAEMPNTIAKVVDWLFPVTAKTINYKAYLTCKLEQQQGMVSVTTYFAPPNLLLNYYPQIPEYELKNYHHRNQYLYMLGKIDQEVSDIYSSESQKSLGFLALFTRIDPFQDFIHLNQNFNV